MEKSYKAKINNLYVSFVSNLIWKEIQLKEESNHCKFLNEREKNYVLRFFPNAEVKEYELDNDF
jgi:hypothetical protein